MNQSLEEIQKQVKQERKIQKGLLISKTKRVRQSKANSNMCVQSGDPKTPRAFYVVVWDEMLQAFLCDCPDFTYNCMPGDRCAHTLACGFHEGGGGSIIDGRIEM